MIAAVVNHLWQSTAFGFAAALLALAFRRNRAQVRYCLWLAASWKFLVPFALLSALASHMAWTPASKSLPAAPVSIVLTQVTEPFPAGSATEHPARSGGEWVPIAASSLWACGFAGVVLVRFRGWRRVRAAVRASTLMDLPGAVEIRSAPGLLEPGVVGCWRPVLLLPAGIMERLTSAQFEAVLAHEFSHIRRRDNLTAVIHMVVEAAFWFHPLVWWIGARLVEARESACDEAVLALGNEPREYAKAILSVCEIYTESPLACVPGVTGADLKKRIEAIMYNRIGARLNWAKKAVLAGAGVTAVTVPVIVGIANAPAIRAQLAPPQKFEVASVKRCPDNLVPGGRGGGGDFSPGRMTLNCQSVMGLINAAYVLWAKDNRGKVPMTIPIEGGPSWLSSERYTINAVAGNTANARVMQGPMMQVLLEERFHVKVHRETREVPVYELVVAKNGPKLKLFQEGSCVPFPLFDAKPPVFEALPAGQRYCTNRGRPEGGNIVVQAEGVTLDDFLTIYLRPSGGRPVIDKTGLTGKYDIHLEFAPPDEVRANQLAAGHDPGEPTAPELSTALQEQLGLKLEPAKGPGEFLVIDHVERPTEN